LRTHFLFHDNIHHCLTHFSPRSYLTLRSDKSNRLLYINWSMFHIILCVFVLEMVGCQKLELKTRLSMEKSHNSCVCICSWKKIISNFLEEKKQYKFKMPISFMVRKRVTWMLQLADFCFGWWSKDPIWLSCSLYVSRNLKNIHHRGL
jgi:hypothetical protein